MKTRVLSAVIFLPLLLAVLLFLPAVYTNVLLAALCAVAAYELLWGTGMVKQPRLIVYTMIAAACVSVWCYLGRNYEWGLAGMLLFSGLLFGELLISKAQLHFNIVMLCFAGGIMIPFLLTAIVRIRNAELGQFMVLLPFVLAFASDTGAYFVGVKLGKHKLAPTISPKKTIEGVIGGVIAAILAALLFCLVLDKCFQLQVNYNYALVYGSLGSLGSVFGDLAFSAIKRQTGIKDYGWIIPGHGGILDRFDSMTVVAPIAEVLLILIPLAEMVTNG